MDNVVIAALTTGVCTVVASGINLIAANLKYFASSKVRARNVKGEWTGVTDQDKGPAGTPIQVQLEVILKNSWRQVHGTARVNGGGEILSVKLSGGFNQSGYLVLSYLSSNSKKVNFGNLILELDSDGDRLSGKMIGFGNKSNGLVKGTTELRRI